MAPSFPLEFLDTWPGNATAKLNLQQELSSQQARRRTADIGDPYWSLQVNSRFLKANDFRRWRALLTALERDGNQFRGRDIMGCRPILYPAGQTFGNASAAVVSVDAHEIVVGGLDAGATISQGDFLSVEKAGPLRSYHLVSQDATESGGSITLPVDPTPAGWVTAGDNVNFVDPECLMIIEPGSVAATPRLSGGGTLSFRGIQS